MDGVKIHIEANINPTESEERVKRAIRDFFGDITLKLNNLKRGNLLIAEGQGAENLRTFKELIRREQIANAARGVLFGGLNGNTINFCLNKQAAYVGHISFSTEETESPLGPIKIRIEADTPKSIIDWLAPKRK